MRRGFKIFAAACIVSLLIHLGLVGTLGRWWELPRAVVIFPLQARLEAPPPSPGTSPAAPTPPRGPATTQAPAAPPMPWETAAPVAHAQAAPLPDPRPLPASDETPAPVSAPAPEPPAPEAAAEPRPGIRRLPEKLILIYDVRFGADGFKLGQATYTWRVRGDRYSLESVAAAEGVAALFLNGRVVQTSEGQIDATGLRPGHFQITKNERRKNIADFDWRLRQLSLPKGSEPMREGTQDLLSFPFHLAMVVMEGEADRALPVTDGRKLKDYLFSVKGRERLAIGGRQIEALHVQGNRAGEDGLDVWLAPARHWLPARIRTRDDKGQVVELTLAELSD